MILHCHISKPWIIEYWTQITFLLLGLGYVIKTIWDSSLKQKEINYTQVTLNKISELKTYLRSFNDLVFVLQEYHFASGQGHNERLPGIQERVYKSWINFLTSYSTLRIFINSSDYPKYEEIKSQLEDIQRTIAFHEIDKSFGTIDKEITEKLWKIRDEVFPKKLPDLIRTIEDSLKREMNIK
jgi:hypothetical protein